MTTIRKGFALVLSVLLGVCLIPLVVGLPLSRTLLAPGYVEGMAQANDIYTQLPGIVSGTVYKSLQELPADQYSAFMKLLTEEQVDILISNVLPDGWMESQVEKFLGSLNDFFHLRTDQITFEVDLEPVKQSIDSENGLTALSGILGTFPLCDYEFLINMLTSVGEGEFGEMTICNPPEEIFPLMEPFFTQALKVANYAIPGKVALPVFTNQPGIVGSKAQGYYQAYREIYNVWIYIPWICGGIGLFIILLSIRNFRTLLRLLGFPILAAGAIGGLSLLVILQRVEEIISGVSSSGTLPDYLKEVVSLIMQMGKGILDGIHQQTLLVSGVFIGTGILFVLISRFIRRRT